MRGMTAHRLRLMSLACVAAAAALAGCSHLRSSGGAKAASGLPESEPYLLVTAAADGEILDCGCKSGPKGGLARRKTLVDTLSAAWGTPLLVDGGDFLAPVSRVVERERAPLMVETMGEMGYGLATFGENDLAYGWSFLRTLAAANGLEFVSANVFDAASGEPLAPAYALRRMGEHRVAIFGVLSPNLPITPASDGTPIPRVDDPVAIAQELVPRLRREADVVVGLLHLPPPEVMAFAQAVPGVDLVVFGHDPSRRQELELVEGTRSTGVRVGARGRHVGMVRIESVSGDRPVFSGRLWTLDTSVPEDPPLRAKLQAAEAELRARFGETQAQVP